jgi:carbon-monoxide dehydrogenase medium subunit
MAAFEIARPSSLREAIELLDPDDPSVRPISGGTALMLMMKSGFFRPTRLVSLRSVEKEFSRIEVTSDGELHIGAVAPLSIIEYSRTVRETVPVLAQTLRTLANVRVRNVAMLGGHLAHGDPHMDLPPVLVVLGARVLVMGPGGKRTISMESLITGHYETALLGNEVIVDLIIPLQKQRHAAYLKCSTRTADDWPALGVAVSVAAEEAGVREVKIVISAATEKPTRLTAAESVLCSADLTDVLFQQAGDAAAEQAAVIADQHGSAEYKKQLVRVYVERALRTALASAKIAASPR